MGCREFALFGYGSAQKLTGSIAAILWLFGIAAIADEPTARPVQASIQGRVVDERGKPVAGARIQLYRRANHWERRNQVVEATTAGPDGSFLLAAHPEPPLSPRAESLPKLVLVADHPGLAVGWRIIPDNATRFAEDITLLKPSGVRTVTVTDADGHPVAGACVAAYDVGDPSSPSSLFREHLGLRPGEPPLAIVTDAGGHARFEGLPPTNVSFVATKPGYAENYIFRGPETIRLTPSASLEGAVIDPSGNPVVGATVVLHAKFMWDIHRTTTDPQGRYRFDDLAANGWDMNAWQAGKTGDGQYMVWIEHDRFAVQERPVTLEPKIKTTLDLSAETASVIRATLIEAGTKAPVVGARLWGLSTGGRLDAITDAQGHATFRTTRGRATLSIASPPPGMYFQGDRRDDSEASKALDVGKGEVEVTLTMPKAGRVIQVTGLCLKADGSPATGTVVWASSGKSQTSEGTAYGRPHTVDDKGRFELDGVASSVTLNLYATADDGRLAGTASVRAPDRTDPTFRVTLTLQPTVAAIHVVDDAQGRHLALEDVEITPRIGEDDMNAVRQSARSDAMGMVRFDHAVSGVAYRFQVFRAANAQAKVQGGPFMKLHDDVTVLIPQEAK